MGNVHRDAKGILQPCHGVSGKQLPSPIHFCVSIHSRSQRMKSPGDKELSLGFQPAEGSRALVQGGNFLHSQGTEAAWHQPSASDSEPKLPLEIPGLSYEILHVHPAGRNRTVFRSLNVMRMHLFKDELSSKSFPSVPLRQL